eukprot:CAMPEP_0184300720 /NCGR_PEP_ID=MMETSP1049-20130417/11093_1 /TAXON_ID=77928 /ORGANISM="Proteomonas sulcata, Strain CCMP704" /LENGTH=91 /DNA_ID=CAMNT_0026611527 /DNA_START=807 /DNA_END=1082 /DNA_ORIENTATION=-
MISKSSSWVMGFSLQTKTTFSGGFMSASGISPTISSTTARDLASAALVARSASAIVISSSSTSGSSASGLSSRSGGGDAGSPSSSILEKSS